MIPLDSFGSCACSSLPLFRCRFPCCCVTVSMPLEADEQKSLAAAAPVLVCDATAVVAPNARRGTPPGDHRCPLSWFRTSLSKRHRDFAGDDRGRPRGWFFCRGHGNKDDNDTAQPSTVPRRSLVARVVSGGEAAAAATTTVTRGRFEDVAVAGALSPFRRFAVSLLLLFRCRCRCCYWSGTVADPEL